MKKSTIAFILYLIAALSFLAYTTSAQVSRDSAYKKTMDSLRAAEPKYTFVLTQTEFNMLMEVINKSDAPHGSLVLPVGELFMKQIEPQVKKQKPSK